MCTGIIEAVGQIQSLQPKGDDIRLTVKVNQLDMSDVALGDSIATNGVCLTVVDFSDEHYSVDVSPETIKRSGFADYKAGDDVNLEKAMQANARLGGHIVSGHVDGVGEIVTIKPIDRWLEVWIKAPDNLAKYLAEKGSITVDGVSLTVNDVDGATFMLTLIPHTMQETIFRNYKIGSKVNLEVDIIARYLERLMLGDNAAKSGEKQDISMEFLAKHGYMK
jgi:riboflavin synthase